MSRSRRYLTLAFACVLPLSGGGAPSLTANANGPYSVEGTRLLDRDGKPFLIRGTSLPPFRLRDVARNTRSSPDFGAHTATALTAVRLRFNLNTVRLPVDAAGQEDPAYRRELDRVVRLANEIGLLVLLADAPENVANHYRASANVLIESALPKDSFVHWDVNLRDSSTCAELDADPAKATATLRARLEGYETAGTSWIVSEFAPGRLIKESMLFDPSTLEDGWSCGDPGINGIGRIVQGHLRGTTERGLIVVTAGGGFDVPRGGYAVAYGPIMAARDEEHIAPVLKTSLGKLRARITDSSGTNHWAGISWTSAGWGQINFIVPPRAALGPAELTLVREDGSKTSAPFLISDATPGLLTGLSCVGVAQGEARQYRGGVRRQVKALGACHGVQCQTLPLPLEPGSVTHVQLRGSGFRNIRSLSELRVTVAGVEVPVKAITPSATEAGIDLVTIAIPATLKGAGETDVLCYRKGRVSNAVRIHLGDGD